MVFAQNHGYIYDASQESTEEIAESILANSSIPVFAGAALNSDEIAVMEKGYIITIIKKHVNVHNRCNWDKVRLADGTEGYIISSSDFTVPNDVVSLNFSYNTKNYELKMSPSFYNVDINDYPYYVVNLVKDNSYPDRFCVIYSKQKIRMYDSTSMWVEFSSTDNMITRFYNLNGTKGARSSRNRNIKG